jgi:hypothetical protein
MDGGDQVLRGEQLEGLPGGVLGYLELLGQRGLAGQLLAGREVSCRWVFSHHATTAAGLAGHEP